MQTCPSSSWWRDLWPRWRAQSFHVSFQLLSLVAFMDLIHLGKPVEGINPLHAEILTLASSRNLLKGSDNFCGPPGMAFNFGKYLAKVMAAPRSSRTKDGGGPLQIASAIGTSQHTLPSQFAALNSTHRVTVRYNKRINLFIVFAQSVFLVFCTKGTMFFISRFHCSGASGPPNLGSNFVTNSSYPMAALASPSGINAFHLQGKKKHCGDDPPNCYIFGECKAWFSSSILIVSDGVFAGVSKFIDSSGSRWRFRARNS